MAKKRKAAPKELVFEYIKSNHFRVVHMNGAYGGLSPSGSEIHMALFNERRAIPRKTVQPLMPNGELGSEDLTKREARSGFVREVEIDVVMDFDGAVNLRKWLDDKITQLSKVQQAAMQRLKNAKPQDKETNGSKQRSKGK